MSKTLLVSNAEAERLLKMGDCIAAMDEVLRDVSAGAITMLQRSMIHHKNGNILAGMPSTIDTKEITGSKVTIFPGPEARKNGTAQGIVPIFDTVTGSLIAIVGAECITTIRTAATSASATRLLAREDASVLGILGAGKLGRAHVEAISLVRPIKKVYIWDIVPEAVDAYCAEMAKAYPNITFIPCKTAKEAVVDADILCTVTKAQEPIVEGEWLKSGVHINAVGACSPVAREMATSVVQKARVYVDKTEAALRDGGDLIIPMNAGEWSADKVVGEVGEILLGKLEGRKTAEEITMFETVGIAVEDLASEYLIYQKAKEQGIGLEVEL